MPVERSAIFLVNLVQDVNILRPLVFMATRDFGMPSTLLVSHKFAGRDLFGIWQNELQEIAAATGARVDYFDSDWEAHQFLTGQGVIFAASESHLHNHSTTHDVFRHCPPGYVRVTLQHGFECVGFRHSADHIRVHGPSASFGADYVCAWSGLEGLASMSPSQFPKLVVTGPTSVLQLPQGTPRPIKGNPGIVCENLHSVRLNAAGDFKMEFVDAFSAFSKRLSEAGRKVALRPHPGGQYSLKSNVPLPPNATIENSPMYRLDLRRYAYGISAPSSVLVDMLIAGIPTAVWRDFDRRIDSDAYAGLATVSTPDEWFDFARSAASDPQPFLELQRQFLERQNLILEPEAVYGRFAELFQTVLRAEVRPAGSVAERERILFVANARVPTLQLSFERPLAPLVARGEIRTELLTETELAKASSDSSDGVSIESWLDQFGPSTIIFCRYSGPNSESIVEWAKSRKVPIIYHIDDDLLNVPAELGERKRAFHSSPQRLQAVRDLLRSADLVYASTDALARKLRKEFPGVPLVTGAIYCPGSVVRRPRRGRARKIGYMASADHAHNLGPILPAIEQLLERNPDIRFEFFGSIPVPPSLERFSDRISTAPPIRDYGNFLSEFANSDWDVGICPLSAIPFNLYKADTKWVEYSSVGAAVVASRNTAYDKCCADGCGLLAEGTEEWLDALERVIENGDERVKMVERAQRKLEREYGESRLRSQVLDVIDKAHRVMARRPCTG